MSIASEVEKIISDYIEQKQRSHYYHKKKNDAEKEYNKLLVSFGVVAGSDASPKSDAACCLRCAAG